MVKRWVFKYLEWIQYQLFDACLLQLSLFVTHCLLLTEAGILWCSFDAIYCLLKLTPFNIQPILVILVQGTTWNSSRYPYLSISDLQNWGKKKLNNHISQMDLIWLLKLEIYWKIIIYIIYIVEKWRNCSLGGFLPFSTIFCYRC